MRKIYINQYLALALILLLLVFAAPDGSLLSSIKHENSSASKATFPEQLRIVDDEAFAGTSIVVSVFSDKLTYIGERAFQDDCLLTDAYIPGSTQFIGADSFPAGTVIHGEEGSYAQMWAEYNGLHFRRDDIWNNGDSFNGILIEHIHALVCVLAIPDNRTVRLLFRRILKYIRSMRPQDRTELYPINYRFP